MATLNGLLSQCTTDYLSTLDMDNLPNHDVIEEELLNKVNNEIRIQNQNSPKDGKLSIQKTLHPIQIAMIMLNTCYIANINCGNSSSFSQYDMLAIYMEYGVNAGLYVSDEGAFARIAKKYNFAISRKELNEVLSHLREEAPRVTRTTDKDLIPCNNGIYNFKTKQLEPFSPDLVYLSKVRVDYNPFAKNIVIHNDDDGTDWDVESWVGDLSDDAEIVDLLWQVLSAVVRPYNRWNRVIWLYASSGCNGKGTLTELARSLVGEGSYASISVLDFSDRFALEPLIHATAIICDENSCKYVDKSDKFKAVATNDVIAIEGKFKNPISFQYFGIQIQCTNSPVRFKDKTNSLYRRMLVIPFDKCFTGVERPYIKNDYLHRKDVLEYVLYKVLNMNFYELSEPEACKKALNDYKECNDPVRQFLEEMLPEFTWDLLPFSFVFDLYKSWSRKNNPNGRIQGRNTFIGDVISILKDYPEWYCSGRNTFIRPGNKMDTPEPLICEYDLVDWKNPHYNGGNIDRICSPELKQHYQGLLRVGSKVDADDTDDGAND